MLALQPTFRSWFWCSSSGSSETARVAGSLWSSVAAATMAAGTVPGLVQRSCAPLSSALRAADTSKALKGGSIIVIVIRNFGDCVAMQSSGA